MKTTYDKEADAVYIYLVDESNNTKVSDTQGDFPFNVDVSEDHQVLGIEVLEARSMFNEKFLSECEQL